MVRLVKSMDGSACSPENDDAANASRRLLDRETFFGAAQKPDSEYIKLARTIESEIIPRLLLAHRFETQRAKTRDLDLQRTDLSEVEDFTKIVLKEETDVAYAYVSGLLARGISLEVLYTNLLAPTARRLGEMWVEDECHFTDVTMALCRLQQLLKEFSYRFGNENDHNKLGFRALLAPVPSDQHTFGILMVEEFFRRSGWNVYGIPAATEKEILEAVEREWFAVVGLSMSCDEYSAQLAGLIQRIRKKSRNSAVMVLVGGRYFNDNPEQAMLLGADATAVDGQEAIMHTQALVGMIGRKN